VTQTFRYTYDVSEAFWQSCECCEILGGHVSGTRG